MFTEIKVNGTYLPRPDENLQFASEKVKKEYETEGGTTAVSIVRQSKLPIKGTWTLIWFISLCEYRPMAYSNHQHGYKLKRIGVEDFSKHVYSSAGKPSA